MTQVLQQGKFTVRLVETDNLNFIIHFKYKAAFGQSFLISFILLEEDIIFTYFSS